jgi:hypothetical protein
MQCFVTWLRRVIKRTQKGRRRGLPKWGPAYAVDGNQYSQPRTDGIAVRTAQGTLGRVAWRTFQNPRDELCWCQCCILRAMISCLGDPSSTRWVPRSRWLFHRSLFHLANWFPWNTEHLLQTGRVPQQKVDLGTLKPAFFLSCRTGARFRPPLGRRNHHKKRFYLQFATHCCWMRTKVPVCIQLGRSFRQISISFQLILQLP